MTETPITSRDNPIFKRLKKLAESARARREVKMSLLDGEHLLTAYLDAGGEPRTLVRAASSEPGRLRPFAARSPQTKTLVLPDALFTELSPVATPTGLLAEVAWLARYGDVVGMSAAPEVRAAAATGVECCLLGLVANKAAAAGSHDEVLAAGARLGRLLASGVIAAVLARWPDLE